MDNPEFLYIFLVLAFVLQQLYFWARLIQWRRHVLYPTPVLLWSLFFMGRLYNILPQHLFHLPILLFLCLHWLLGWLLFPSVEGLDYKSSYTYIDVYENLRQQRFWVFGIAILGELLLLYYQWGLGIDLDLYSFLGLFLFSAAFLTQHKGLMLVWVWLGLSFVFFW